MTEIPHRLPRSCSPRWQSYGRRPSTSSPTPHWCGRAATQHAIWLHTPAAGSGDTDAVWDLAQLRERVGDTAGAEALYQRAADRGDPGALRDLAELRERVGDTAGAETLYQRAADHGDPGALRTLAKRRERAENTAGADQVRRFGLTGTGEVATTLDFDS